MPSGSDLSKKLRPKKVQATTLTQAVTVDWEPGDTGDPLDAQGTLALTDVALEGAVTAQGDLDGELSAEYTELTAQGQATLPEVALEGTLTAQGQAAFDVALEGNLTSQGQVTLPEISLEGLFTAQGDLDGELSLEYVTAMTAQGQAAFDAAVEGNFTGQGSVTFPEASLSHTKMCRGQLQQTDLSLEHTKTCAGDVTELQWVTSVIQPSKDATVRTRKTVGVCNDDENAGADTTLRTANDAVNNDPFSYLAFDLTGFPSNATVTAATLTIKQTNDNAGMDHNYHLHSIASADEGWLENDIRCSNRPIETNTVNQVFTGMGDLGDLIITLGAAARTYIEGRMGSANTCTFVFKDEEMVGQILNCESKEAVGENGPRLVLTFTTPV